MFVYNLPYQERKALCRILDINSAWEQLGGAYMRFDVTTLQHFQQAPSRSHSPTDEMLTLWGTQNHTVLELFTLLSRMQHYQAMMVLKPLVDEKYHKLIYEGEENFSKFLPENGQPNLCNQPMNQNKEDKFARCLQELNGNLNIYVDDEDHHTNRLPKSKSKTEKFLIDLEDESPSRRTDWDEQTLFSEGISPAITYEELEHATSCWDRRNLLGKGGFGTVYKGFWKNTEVAIKRLEVQRGEDMDETYRTNRKQSLRELKCLNSFRHDNILPLYGYSIGGLHDCLVYQYMPNGSLEDRLLCKESSKPLTWCNRQSIATGTARGLQYLHTIGDKPLIHGDIKSANILLDPYLVPKIGDFGLAREGPIHEHTHLKVSKVHGTRPYLPDEFLRAKKLSTKVDTFSFGVVLFELATGLRAYDEHRLHKYLKEHVESMNNENIVDLRDKKAGCDDGNTFHTLIFLGHWCVSLRAKDRPEMVEVLQNLEHSKANFSPQPSVSPNTISPAFKEDLQCFIPSESCNDLEHLPRHNNQPEVVSHIATPGPSHWNHISNGVPQNSYKLENKSSNSFADTSSEECTVNTEAIVDPSSSPVLSDLLPSTVNRDVSGAAIDLPLISALGINTDPELDNNDTAN